MRLINLDEVDYLFLLEELKKYKWITVIEIDLTLKYCGKNIVLRNLSDLGYMGYGLRKVNSDIEAIFWKKVSDERFAISRHIIRKYIVHQAVFPWGSDQVAGISKNYPNITNLVS